MNASRPKPSAAITNAPTPAAMRYDLEALIDGHAELARKSMTRPRLVQADTAGPLTRRLRSMPLTRRFLSVHGERMGS